MSVCVIACAYTVMRMIVHVYMYLSDFHFTAFAVGIIFLPKHYL